VGKKVCLPYRIELVNAALRSLLEIAKRSTQIIQHSNMFSVDGIANGCGFL
jgi:hypothetical protein